MVEKAAESGKVALSGVMGHRQATSWPLQDACIECLADRTASCIKLLAARAGNAVLALAARRGRRLDERCCKDMVPSRVHDVVFVPDYLVYQALCSPTGGRDLLWQCTRRIKWAGAAPQDHAVTYGYVFVGPMSVGGPSSAGVNDVGGGRSFGR